MSLIDLFKPAAHLKEIQDTQEIQSKYRYWRIRTFLGMYVGYVFFYFTRNSANFIMPALMEDLGLTLTDLGFLGSMLTITLGLSKFLSGILSDQANPRYFMAAGLIMTGIFNICFGFSATVTTFAIFWGLNGFFQGWGWPPCARLLTHWYSQKERGTWWGVWSTSHSVGGALVPFLVAFLCKYVNWRYAMVIPGWLAIATGFALIYTLRDTPQSLGLPTIEKYKNDYPTEEAEQKQAERELSAKEILVQYVLRNKYIWALAVSYFLVYLVRGAINAWSVIFLMKSKGYTLLAASASIFWFEMGGILGSLVAGWASDKLFQGRRGPINALFNIGVVLSVIAFFFVPPGYLVLDYLAAFSIGLFVYGPQMLIGIAAAELSHKKAAGTATGFVGWVGYLGAAAAGFPLSQVIQNLGWGACFTTLALAGGAATLLLLPMWAVRAGPKTAPATQEAALSSEEAPAQDA